MNSVELTILGCGSSSGTPAIGCHCPTCSSPDPRNRRTRCSAYLRAGNTAFLIDTGPDLRQQALREGFSQVDAVLYTHPHADHLNGIDDLRAFCYVKQGPITLFGNAFTLDNIRSRFDYTLAAPSPQWDKPVLQTEQVHGAFEFQGIHVQPIELEHGNWPCLGWRIGNVAWLTDLSNIPEVSLAKLQGLEVLFLDCLREKPYKSHLGVEQSLEWAARIGAKRTVLIHMTHGLEYHALGAQCPPGVEVGYDGLKVEVPLTMPASAAGGCASRYNGTFIGAVLFFCSVDTISWIAVTNFGSAALLLPLAIAIALCLLAGRAWEQALLWLVVFCSGVLLVFITKALFLGWGIGAHAIDFTGISGHAMLASAIFPTAAYLVFHRRSPAVRLACAALAGLIGVAVAVSRVVLNAHSISEVLAGIALGVLVCTAFILLSRRYEGPALKGRTQLLVFALLLVTLYGQRLPTQHWIREVAMAAAGHHRPFIREVWHRHPERGM